MLPQKNTIIGITYIVVVLSIIVQGLSLQPLVNKLFPGKKSNDQNKNQIPKSKSTSQ